MISKNFASASRPISSRISFGNLIINAMGVSVRAFFYTHNIHIFVLFRMCVKLRTAQ